MIEEYKKKIFELALIIDCFSVVYDPHHNMDIQRDAVMNWLKENGLYEEYMAYMEEQYRKECENGRN